MESPFWQADNARKAVYNQFKSRHGDLRDHQELEVHEPEQRERLGQGRQPGRQRKIPVDKAVDEMIARIKEVAG